MSCYDLAYKYLNEEAPIVPIPTWLPSLITDVFAVYCGIAHSHWCTTWSRNLSEINNSIVSLTHTRRKPGCPRALTHEQMLCTCHNRWQRPKKENLQVRKARKRATICHDQHRSPTLWSAQTDQATPFLVLIKISPCGVDYCWIAGVVIVAFQVFLQVLKPQPRYFNWLIKWHLSQFKFHTSWLSKQSTCSYL